MSKNFAKFVFLPVVNPPFDIVKIDSSFLLHRLLILFAAI